MKVIVVGAGASGIIAALKASENHEVLLLDSNDKCGKKILLTGNGHCNYWNSDINLTKYETDDFSNLEKIISSNNQSIVFDYLSNLGIYPRIKNGYYYPYSNQATSIREILEKSINNSHIKFLNNCHVLNIKKANNDFIVTTTNGIFNANKVIIATGSKAYSKTGSTGEGYEFAKSFNHTINKVLPALTKLYTSSKSLKDIENVRCDAELNLLINGEFIKKESGEIQLSNDGISGICTFNISSPASKAIYLKQDVRVIINFLPYLEEDIRSFLDKRASKLTNQTVEEMLESIFNYKLMFCLLKNAHINKNSYWNNLSKKEQDNLISMITSFPLTISHTENFDKSQVCTGGVSLKEINPDNMESLLTKNLHFTGEILDVDGMCGGYNLSFAFITGYLAGSDIND